MKKIYLLLLMLVSTLSFGQGTPIITMIADGDESGGTPKVLEIYAHGTVDFSEYTLQKAPNGGAWGNDFDLSPLGIVTDDFVYIYTNGSNSNDPFTANFPSVTANKLDAGSAQAVNFNGDDPVRIIVTSSSAVVDTFGEDGVDGTGTAWEYKDGYAKRLNGTGPDPVFVVANWEFHNGELNTHGAAQDGTTYESIIGIGTYTPPTVANPTLVITDPSDGEVFAPNTTDVDVVFTITNFTVANGTGDGYIVYTVDGGTATDKFDTTPITVTGLTAGTTHTVNMELVDNSGNALNPAVTASVTFEIGTYTQVATLADLRAGTVGSYYHYTGEAFTTAGKPVGNSFIGYAQDATAGIAAFVPAGTSTNQPDLGDGISDIKGQLSDYHGVLQIVLTEDYTMTGNNQVQVPQVVTIADYKANHDDYESELIRFDNVTIDPGTDTEFQSSTNYDVTDGTETVVLRTNFPDLVGETIPTTAVNMSGIAAEYNGTAQIFPRDINDIVDVNAIAENQIDGLSVYPNPVADKVIYVSSANGAEKQIIIYNILGKVVYNTNVNNNEAINIGQLKAGMYMMKIIENNKVALQKILVK